MTQTMQTFYGHLDYALQATELMLAKDANIQRVFWGRIAEDMLTKYVADWRQHGNRYGGELIAQRLRQQADSVRKRGADTLAGAYVKAAMEIEAMTTPVLH